jgi:hypothetical protein
MMNTSVSVTCPKSKNPVIFILPPQSEGGKTEFCEKCSNMVTIVFYTDRDDSIRDIKLT